MGVIWQRNVSIKSEIIANLSFLISSAKERGTQQGIETFSRYIELLSATNNEQETVEELYNELSSMQRFADFNRKEWQSLQIIFSTIASSR